MTKPIFTMDKVLELIEHQRSMAKSYWSDTQIAKVIDMEYASLVDLFKAEAEEVGAEQ